MIIPLQLAGLALAGSMLVKKGDLKLPGSRKLAVSNPRPTPRHSRPKGSPPTNPVQMLIKNLSSSLSKVMQRPATEDYNAVVKSFLPKNASLLTPQSHAGTGNFRLGDVDGDSRNEIAVSYKLNNEITTVVLKKRDNQWNKLDQITDSKCDAIRYMGFTNITGEGKKQLLIGRKTKDGLSKIYGYSLKNGKLCELFNRSYDILDILEIPQGKGTSPKAYFALWNKSGKKGYNVELLRWNGSELEPVKNHVTYYYQKVLPYYAGKVKQTPQDPSNWYYLADALGKLGLPRDGLMAVEIGMSLKPASPSIEEFMELKRQLQGKA